MDGAGVPFATSRPVWPHDLARRSFRCPEPRSRAACYVLRFARAARRLTSPEDRPVRRILSPGPPPLHPGIARGCGGLVGWLLITTAPDAAQLSRGPAREPIRPLVFSFRSIRSWPVPMRRADPARLSPDRAIGDDGSRCAGRARCRQRLRRLRMVGAGSQPCRAHSSPRPADRPLVLSRASTIGPGPLPGGLSQRRQRPTRMRSADYPAVPHVQLDQRPSRVARSNWST